MKRISLILCATLALLAAFATNNRNAQAFEEFDVWNGVAPGEKPDATKPTYEYWAPEKKTTDACMIVCNIFNHCPVYRIGGDEFVAILRGGAYKERKELMERLETSNRLNAYDSKNICIAGGLAIWDPDNDASMASVFNRADQAMYIDKKRLKELSASGVTTREETR